MSAIDEFAEGCIAVGSLASIIVVMAYFYISTTAFLFGASSMRSSAPRPPGRSPASRSTRRNVLASIFCSQPPAATRRTVPLPGSIAVGWPPNHPWHPHRAGDGHAARGTSRLIA
jgi:hypothetical protein